MDRVAVHSDSGKPHGQFLSDIWRNELKDLPGVEIEDRLCFYSHCWACHLLYTLSMHILFCSNIQADIPQLITPYQLSSKTGFQFFHLGVQLKVGKDCCVERKWTVVHNGLWREGWYPWGYGGRWGMDPGIIPPTLDAFELWLAILSYAFMYLGLPLSASESVSLLFAHTRNTFLSLPVRTPCLPPHMFTLLTLSGPFSFNVTSYSKLSLPFQYLVWPLPHCLPLVPELNSNKTFSHGVTISFFVLWFPT